MQEDDKNQVSCVAQMSPVVQEAIGKLYAEYTNKL